MNIDDDKVDEVVLALLQLTAFKDGDCHRAWKGHDWDVMSRLHEKGFIGDPVGKAKSVTLTEAGLNKSRELFEKHFEVE
jgi:hypothetical protein